MCFLSIVWKVSLDLLISPKCSYILCITQYKCWTYKLEVQFDPWFDESVKMSCVTPSLHSTTNPQLCMLYLKESMWPYRVWVFIWSPMVVLPPSLKDQLAVLLNLATKPYWLVSFGYWVSFSLSLSLSHTHTHTHHYHQHRYTTPTNNSFLYSHLLFTTFALKSSILLYIYFLICSRNI